MTNWKGFGDERLWRIRGYIEAFAGRDWKNEQNYQSEQLLTRPDSNPYYLKYKSTALLLHHLSRLHELLTLTLNGGSGQPQADAHSIRGWKSFRAVVDLVKGKELFHPSSTEFPLCLLLLVCRISVEIEWAILRRLACNSILGVKRHLL
jgi:hypothetical protein